MINGNFKHGFTIVELLVVLSVIALLLTIVTPRYLNKVDEGKEIVLKQNLAVMRRSIDQYYAEQGVYPAKLSHLVEKKYIRAIPVDPITEMTDWNLVIDSNSTGIYDIKSKSSEASSDSRAYSEW